MTRLVTRRATDYSLLTSSRAHQGKVFDVKHFDVLALLALLALINVCFTYTRVLVFSCTHVRVLRGLMMCVALLSPCGYG